MFEAELENLARHWIEFQRAFLRANSNSITEELEGASDEVLHMPFDAPEKTWEFIQAVIKACDEDDVLSSLAAGPIEDLMSKHGEHFIDRVELLARHSLKFRRVLAGVWRGEMSDGVWERIEALQSQSLD